LQKDKAKQNFKGFVDTELIDDSLRNQHSNHDHDDDNNNSNKNNNTPFIPTVPPAVRVTVSTSSSVEGDQPPISPFAPTSLPFIPSPLSSTTEKQQQQHQQQQQQHQQQQQQQVHINEHLDKLQSSLDPWARIQEEARAATATTDCYVSSTTK